jgi:hypothetical protein
MQQVQRRLVLQVSTQEAHRRPGSEVVLPPFHCPGRALRKEAGAPPPSIAGYLALLQPTRQAPIVALALFSMRVLLNASVFSITTRFTVFEVLAPQLV